MPSPFSRNQDGPSEARPGSEDVITISGELYCEACFYPSTEGVYHPESKRLFWQCENEECGYYNAVKGIEIE